MSVKLKFQGESVQGGSEGAVEAIYVIIGAATKEAALDQLVQSSDAPATLTHAVYGTLLREKVPTVEEIDAEQGYWTGTVRWVPAEFSGEEQAEPVVSFNTIGGTAHILQSKERITQEFNPALIASAPDTIGAIGVSGDGSVEGTDIIVPVYEWDETHELSASMVTSEYRKMLFRLTGTVCDGVFRDYARGEGLFMGASGSRKGRGASRPWEVNYRFAGSANATGIKIGDCAPIDKLGWDYLWVFYVQKDDPGPKIIVPNAAAVYIERVYDYKPWDFMPPGSGTP